MKDLNPHGQPTSLNAHAPSRGMTGEPVALFDTQLDGQVTVRMSHIDVRQTGKNWDTLTIETYLYHREGDAARLDPAACAELQIEARHAVVVDMDGGKAGTKLVEEYVKRHFSDLGTTASNFLIAQVRLTAKPPLVEKQPSQPQKGRRRPAQATWGSSRFAPALAA